MTRFLLAISIPVLLNLAILNQANAGKALQHVEITKGKNPQRRLGITGAHEESYYWTFENRGYTILVAIDNQEYNRVRGYKRQRRYNLEYFPPLVREGTEALEDLVLEFSRVMSPGWSAQRKVDFVFAFVQSLPYTKDVTTGYNEYYKYAIETLAEGGGDCEDTSILMASILGGLEFEVALIWFPRDLTTGQEGHIAIGVKGKFKGNGYYRYGNSKYYYCETTGYGGLKLGQVPKQYKNKQATVMPITLQPSSPKKVLPNVTLPKPMPPPPLSPQENLQEGIKLYEQARFNEAIRSVRSALNGLGNPEQRAKARVYLGCSKRGFGEADDNVFSEFHTALRHNPNLRLPTRIGEDHPVFKPMLEKARKESTGTLTITASLPQTKIWIGGSLIKRKMLGAGTESVRLFKGDYTVEGIIYKVVKKTTVCIKPGVHQNCNLEMPLPPIIDSVEVIINRTITVKARVNSSVPVAKATVHYDSRATQDFESWSIQLLKYKPLSDTYVGEIPMKPNQKEGTIWYFVRAATVEGMKTDSNIRLLRIEGPPKIILLKPRAGERFYMNQPIPIEARVISNAAVNDVHVYYDSASSQLSETSPSQPLQHRLSSDTYIGEIPMKPNQKEGTIWFFITATNAEGKKSTPKIKSVEITKIKSVEITKIKSVEITKIKSVEITKTGETSLDKDESSGSDSHGRERKPPPEPEPRPTYPLHERIWVSHSWSSVVKNGLSSSNWERGNVFSIGYLSEGKGFQTLGAQLDFSYENPVNTSATIQWGRPLRDSHMAFAFLAGAAGFRPLAPSSSQPRQSAEIVPFLGGSLKFYPLDNVAIDLTGSIKLRSTNGAGDRESDFTRLASSPL